MKALCSNGIRQIQNVLYDQVNVISLDTFGPGARGISSLIGRDASEACIGQHGYL